MRAPSLLVSLMIVFVAAVPANAAEIETDLRGTWTETGTCPQPRRILIGDKSVSLIEPGRTRILGDGDQSVFNGETVINASLPAKRAEDPELAFSAKLIEQDGERVLVTEGLADKKSFAGTFKRCKNAPLQTAARKDKKKAQHAMRAQSRMIRPAPSYQPVYPAYPPMLFGGLY